MLTLILIVVGVALALALTVKKVRTYLKVKFGVIRGNGSAFVKIAEADAKELEAKGRIIAIDSANAVKAKSAAFLHKEAARVHAAADAVKDDFDAVLEKL